MESRNSVCTKSTASSDEFYQTNKKKWYCLSTKRRWILAAILMLGNYCTISMRTHIGVAMVCMVNASAVYQMRDDPAPILPELAAAAEKSIITPHEYKCRKLEVKEIGNESGYKGTFEWSNEQQSLLFSAGFYGNLLTMFFSGLLISQFGPKIIALIAMIGMSVTMALSPVLAYMNFYYYFGIRFVYGAFENPVYPALSALLSAWFPSTEKSTAAAIFTSGSQISASFGILLATALCSLDFLNGWPLIFYTMAATGFIWVIIWALFVTNKPGKSKFLSDAEKEYLENKNGMHLPTIAGKKRNSLAAIPYRQMLLSRATIAVITASFAHKMTQTFMQIFLPSYARDVLILDLQDNGFFTSVPFLCNLVSKYFLSICVDIMKKKKIVSPTGSCIFFQAFANFGTAIVLGILAVYVDCTKEMQALLLLGAYGVFVGSAVPGFTTSQLSIAPMYTGMISSLTMVSGSIGNLLGPAIVGFFVDKGTRSEWGMVFGFIALVNCFAGIVFCLFGSAEAQTWAQPLTPPSSDASLDKTYEKYCHKRIEDCCKDENVNKVVKY